MKKNFYYPPAIKMLHIQHGPIAGSVEGDISDEPATEPALARDGDFEEEEYDDNPWERNIWED